MVKKYKIQRIPLDVYDLIKDHRSRVQLDVSRLRGKKTTIPITKFLRYTFSPEFKRHIELDLGKVASDFRKRRKYV